ncbi:hypothetical protein RAN3_4474 [plant metagenome]|uniref:Uncharacterized protein n=1 Tax=plant metagenome TaxID=1297885 RepID=A0A484UWX7_9ZZZZ
MAGRGPAGADRRGRAAYGGHPSDRAARDPELGEFQRRSRHHLAFRPAGQRRRAQPRRGSRCAPQPDPGRHPRERHGDGGEPERRGVQRQQPGERAQPGGGCRFAHRQPVPRCRPVWRRRRAGVHGRAGCHSDRARSAAGNPSAGLGHARRGLRSDVGPGGVQRRRDRDPARPGAAGRGGRLLHPARLRHARQPAFDHAGQRGGRPPRAGRRHDGRGRQYRADRGPRGRRHADGPCLAPGRRGGGHHHGRHARHHPPAQRRRRCAGAGHAGGTRHHGGAVAGRRTDCPGQPARGAAEGVGRAGCRAHQPRLAGLRQPVAPARPARSVAHRGRVGPARGFRQRQPHACHGRATGRERGRAGAAAGRRDAGRGRRRGRQGGDGVQQRAGQRAGQRAARRAGEPGQRRAEQWRRLDRPPFPAAPGGGHGWLRGRALVHPGRVARSGRLPGQPAPRHRRVGRAGWHHHAGRQRSGDARRLGHQPGRRFAGRRERLHAAELAARAGWPLVRGLARARQPAVSGCLPRLRSAQRPVGRHAAPLRSGAGARPALGGRLHRRPRRGPAACERAHGAAGWACRGSGLPGRQAGQCARGGRGRLPAAASRGRAPWRPGHRAHRGPGRHAAFRYRHHRGRRARRRPRRLAAAGGRAAGYGKAGRGVAERPGPGRARAGNRRRYPHRRAAPAGRRGRHQPAVPRYRGLGRRDGARGQPARRQPCARRRAAARRRRRLHAGARRRAGCLRQVDQPGA